MALDSYLPPCHNSNVYSIMRARSCSCFRTACPALSSHVAPSHGVGRETHERGEAACLMNAVLSSGRHASNSSCAAWRPPGIKTGMKSYPSSDEVLEALGDKVTDALSRSALLAKEDLLEYRRLRPAWVAAHSERGLANWIHDRQWDHLVALLTGVAGVSFVDKEPVRDIWVGITYQLRIKRHHWDGRVSIYPTQAALDFLAQPATQGTLEGLDEVHLIAAYRWVKELRDIAAGVLSLRDGLDRRIWEIELPLPGAPSAGITPLPVSPTPTAPTIETTIKEKGEEKQT